MTWLITGGSGQLGIAVSRELGRRGILSVACNSKDLDITKGPIVRDLIADLSPIVVINCAAWTDVDAAEASHARASEVNGEGAKNVAFGAKLVAAKLFQISTDYVFSGESAEPWQTNEIVNPKTIYGLTKAEGERQVLEVYPENSSIIRTAWLYSPWGKNFAKTMTWLALNGNGVVHVVNDQLGQPTSAMDLANQLIDLGLSSSPVGIYHGTNSGEATWYEFAKVIFELVGADTSRVVPVSSNEYPRPAKRPPYSVLSHDSWSKTSVQPMRDWRIAIKEALPAIISAVKLEE